MPDKTSIMKEAQKYLSKGQIDKAIAEWEKLVKEAPDGPTYNIVGDLYLRKGDKKKAVESYHKAANFFRHEGFSLKALALYKKLLNINASDHGALLSLGELSEEKDLIADAIKYYLASADSLIKEGKKDGIVAVYGKIVALAPQNVPLRTKVAGILMKEGLKSNAAREYLSIAEIQDERGEVSQAKEFYQKAIDVQPLTREALIGLCRIQEKTGDMDSALETMKEAAVLFPEDVEILLQRAEISLVARRIEDAKESLQRLIEHDPMHLKARRLLGDIFRNEGKRDEAWAVFLPVVDNMLLSGKHDEGITLLEEFKDADRVETGRRLVSLFRQLGETDRFVDELISLGDALKERGLEEEAVACYQEAQEMRPDNAEIRERVQEPAEEPEPHPMIEFPAEAEQPRESVLPAPRKEKSLEEVMAEADIFSRYGLVTEALRLLEGLRARIPDSAELHLRLKSLYADVDDKEAAVTECLVLSELYRRSGDVRGAEKALREAHEIHPSDPRLAERGLLEPTSFAEEQEPIIAEGAERPRSIEDFEEEIAEADFYARQGLTQEALKVLERLHTLFPENAEITERLENLGQSAAMPEPLSQEETPAPAEPLILQEEEVSIDSLAELAGVVGSAEGDEGKPGTQGGDDEFESVLLTEEDLGGTQEMPEPALDSDVLEIFEEFKRGLASELEEEDSETHYNLGIAYKEMGLIDDAIKEFQTARKDSKRFIQSSTMLGICYMEKGLYSLAIDVLYRALKDIRGKDETYWAIRYDLADAYARNGNLKEALDIFTEVFGWNARFRNVSEKMDEIRIQLSKAGPQKTIIKKDRVSYL